MSRAWRALGFGLAGVLFGCGSHASVGLTGRIESLALSVEQRALGTFLSGDFAVAVSLGKYADDPVTVRTATCSLIRAETGEELGLGPLNVEAIGPALPREVGPGDTLRVGYQLGTNEPVANDATATLCAAPIALRAVIEHSFDGGGTLTVTSAALTPAGCP